MPEKNKLYYGDNLQVLREYVADESVDLVYLDPPFNSRQDYNVLFAERDGTRSVSQVTAFKDTWEWNNEAARAYEEVVVGGGEVGNTLSAFRTLFGGGNDLLAYLSMMASRLSELHRVIKSTGSLYLHCDPTASHYLKLLLDSVFGPEQFRSEIVWRRTGSHNKAQRWAPIHDTIFFYSKTNQFIWNHPKRPYMYGHVKEHFVEDERGGFRTNYYGNVLTGSGLRGGESGQSWQGFDPSLKNRHWAIPRALLDDVAEDTSKLSQHQKLDLLHQLGHITITPGQAWPIYQRRIRSSDGPAASDIWSFQPYTEETVFGSTKGVDDDVRWLSPKDAERLGYPTQKPEGLLARILKASSNEGDLVLDPFCGCGTTVQVAQRLNRRWIGIDITHLAIGLIKTRLHDTFGPEVKATYDVIGEPTDLAGAQQLALENKFQFQAWALSLCDARRTDSDRKGADRGIDGRAYFFDDNSLQDRPIIFSVKGGRNVGVSEVRDLIGVLQREQAIIGVYISLTEPTKPMQREAAEAGFYTAPDGSRVPRVQLLSIAGLLDESEKLQLPPHARMSTFKRAPRFRPQVAQNLELNLGGEA